MLPSGTSENRTEQTVGVCVGAAGVFEGADVGTMMVAVGISGVLVAGKVVAVRVGEGVLVGAGGWVAVAVEGETTTVGVAVEPQEAG